MSTIECSIFEGASSTVEFADKQTVPETDLVERCS
jgi:hypothetical protein